MLYRRPCRRSTQPNSPGFKTNRKRPRPAATLLVIFFATLACVAQDRVAQGHDQDQDRPQTGVVSSRQPNQTLADNRSATITIPAGTRIALVLTQPVQTRYLRRGDDIYAQINAPVNAGNEEVIPPGTFVQGTVDKLERNGGRGELRLQSVAITFADGYVAPIAGPITLVSDDGYALKDPGHGRVATAFILPFAGVGLGALAGHAVKSSPTTITSTLPPGCTGPPPGCLTSSVTGPSNSGKNIVIGAGIGGAVGAIASLALLFSSHHFYLEAGAPVQMTLQQSVALQQNEVALALRHSQQQPLSIQPVAPLPLLYPYPWQPDSTTPIPTPPPPSPPIVIPGPPGPDGVPGPPIVIPQSLSGRQPQPMNWDHSLRSAISDQRKEVQRAEG